MQLDNDTWRMLMNEAAYSLIREHAPNELPLYVRTRDSYFADPESFTASISATDDPMGAGVVEVLQNFSHTVFPLLTPILTALVAAVATALKEEGTTRAVAEVRKLFAKPEPVLTQAQLEDVAAEIRTAIKRQQRQHQLDPALADAVGDAIIARLALAKKE